MLDGSHELCDVSKVLLTRALMAFINVHSKCSSVSWSVSPQVRHAFSCRFLLPPRSCCLSGEGSCVLRFHAYRGAYHLHRQPEGQELQCYPPHPPFQTQKEEGREERERRKGVKVFKIHLRISCCLMTSSKLVSSSMKKIDVTGEEEKRRKEREEKKTRERRYRE